MIKCDFCCEPLEETQAQRYHCEDFEAGPGLGMLGDWAGCPTCAPLVDSAQWEKLHRRSVECFIREHSEPPRIVVEVLISYLHMQFRKHRIV